MLFDDAVEPVFVVLGPFAVGHDLFRNFVWFPLTVFEKEDEKDRQDSQAQHDQAGLMEQLFRTGIIWQAEPQEITYAGEKHGLHSSLDEISINQGVMGIKDEVREL